MRLAPSDRPLSPVEAFRTGAAAYRTGEKDKAIHSLEYAADNGHTYLDYFAAMVDPQGMLQKDLSEDGLHPNAKGYAVMSPLAEQAIRLAIKRH